MKKVIRIASKHKCTTDANPQYENCPSGLDSWWTYQIAKANNELRDYKYKPTLHANVPKAITPIYKEWNNGYLLEHYVGGFSENWSEGLNNLIWSFDVKRVFRGITTVRITAYIAVSMFNSLF